METVNIMLISLTVERRNGELSCDFNGATAGSRGSLSIVNLTVKRRASSDEKSGRRRATGTFRCKNMPAEKAGPSYHASGPRISWNFATSISQNFLNLKQEKPNEY
jgi:hypothetical protein